MVQIVDTTLRDGEQRAGIALNVSDKVMIAKMLDYIGVNQIEAGTPVMGGSERKAIESIVGLRLHSKISAWNRMQIKDIEASIACGVDIVHISVPSSDLHISQKLNQTRNWVLDRMKMCIEFAVSHQKTVHIGLEDASRAEMEFLLKISAAAHKTGAKRIRYADTVGILTPSKAYEDLHRLTDAVDTEWGIHVHNDFGMAVANSLAAIHAGVQFVDCTVGGVGERAGNCNVKYLLTALRQTGYSTNVNMSAEDTRIIEDDKGGCGEEKSIEAIYRRLRDAEEEILNIFYNRFSSSGKTFSFA